MTSSTLFPAKPARAPILDLARGIAVVAMVIYHFSWDLSYFGFIEQDVAFAPGWRLFAQGIAGSFLFISGVSLAYSSRSGIDWRKAAKRFLLVGGAALGVTVGTWFVFPDRYIFFGILHCLALTGLLALSLCNAHLAVLGVFCAAALLLPAVFKSAMFDAPALIWLGLAERVPVTNDFVPLFPWFGFVLGGLMVGRIILRRSGQETEHSGSLLEILGRWSLPIYLVHQPLLFGGFMALASLGVAVSHVVGGDSDVKVFVADCASECSATGAQAILCQNVCTCTAQKLQPMPFWKQVIAGDLTPAQRQQVEDTGRKCLAASLKSTDFNAKP